jgi:hypothetical protein
MATTTVDIKYAAGVAGMTCDIFGRGGASAEDSGLSLTEYVNKKGVYWFQTSQALSGVKDVVIYNSGGDQIAHALIYLEDDNATWYEVEASNLDAVAGNAVQHDGNGRPQVVNSDNAKIAALADFAMVGSVDAGSVSPTTTKVALDNSFPDEDGALTDRVLVVKLGGNHLDGGRILKYTGSNRLCELDGPMAQVAQDGDPVIVTGLVK